MKIYLCTACNKTIPLKDLVAHRQQCGPNAEITIKKSAGAKAGEVFKTIFMVLAAIAFAGLGIWLGVLSFRSIASMRQLERIPATVVLGVLPGEVNLNGIAQRLDRVLKAPKSGTPCLHYRYRVEVEERDSEGDKHWRVISDDTFSTDFVLKDGTGEIVVRTSGRIDFSLPESFEVREGNHRYTEWRIDPDDNLFIFGCAVNAGAACEVRFDAAGCYDPIISKHGERRERTAMACVSIGECWGGLVALALATSLAAAVLRIHKLLVYFSILSTVIAVDLVILGVRMMENDLRAAVNRLNRHEQTARDIISRDLRERRIDWDGTWDSLGSFAEHEARGLKKTKAERLSRIRIDLALATERVRIQRNAFPERLFAPGWKIPDIPPLPLPDSAKTEFARLAGGFEKAQVQAGAGWGIIAGSSLLALISLVFGFRNIRFKRCIENIPTSETAGAAYGLSEFKGVVKLPSTEEPLHGPLSAAPCVEYHYLVKEKRGSGKHSHWVTIVDDKQARPFLCEDHEGSIWIDPDGAKTMTSHLTSRHKGRRSYTETRLELDDPVYAIGECAIEPSTGDRLYLRKPQDIYPFILSNLTESTVMRKIAAVGITLLNISFAAILLTGLTMFGLTGSFSATDYLASALAAPAFMILITFILHINDLVFLRRRADRNWSNIDVSLQKRHDLLPSLQKTVESYMAHEAGVQKAMSLMRSTYGNGRASDPESVGAFMQNEQAALSQMLGVFENYPELKSDRQAALLMRTMVLLENEICMMRKGYNDAVETYNTRIRQFPDVLFAKMLSLKEKQFIQAEADVTRMPPSLQNIWRKDVVEKTRRVASQQPPAATGQDAGLAATSPFSAMAAAVASTTVVATSDEDGTADAVDARSVVFALLLSADDSVRAKQLAAVAERDSPNVRKKTESLIAAVAGDAKDDVARLRTAEDWFRKLESLSPGGYNTFRDLVRELIEADQDISLLEYALQKSMTYRLDKVFGMGVARRARYQDLSLLVEKASLALSRLVYAEEKPDETGKAAFDLGVAQLNYAPKSDFTLVPRKQCTLAAFDEAIEEIAQATNATKANFLYACGEAVKMDNDYSYDQALLLMAMADTFDLPRPDWC